MRILATGFEPFGGSETNPSWEAACRLPKRIAGHTIEAARLPVEYDRAIAELMRLIYEIKPDAVISLGQAAGRGSITPELVAVNCAYSPAPDASGAQYSGIRLLPFGADGYFTNLRAKAGADAMNAAGVPASLSRDAGGYVCNAVMYAALCLCRLGAGEGGGTPAPASASFATLRSTQDGMRALAEMGFANKLRCGFVHLPLTPGEAAKRGRGEPSMELETMVAGLKVFIPAALDFSDRK